VKPVVPCPHGVVGVRCDDCYADGLMRSLDRPVIRCSSCGADGHDAEHCPHDYLTPLREAIDEALALWESKPDDAGIFPSVNFQLGQWRRIREALAKS
jgi:hypothetical protein